MNGNYEPPRAPGYSPANTVNPVGGDARGTDVGNYNNNGVPTGIKPNDSWSPYDRNDRRANHFPQHANANSNANTNANANANANDRTLVASSNNRYTSGKTVDGSYASRRAGNPNDGRPTNSPANQHTPSPVAHNTQLIQSAPAQTAVAPVTTPNTYQQASRNADPRIANGVSGVGLRLGDIPDFVTCINSLDTYNSALVYLAQLCGWQPTNSMEQMKNVIFAFRGFESDDHRTRAFHQLRTVKKKDVETICWLLAVSRTGQRSYMIQKIMEYLHRPTFIKVSLSKKPNVGLTNPYAATAPSRHVEPLHGSNNAAASASAAAAAANAIPRTAARDMPSVSNVKPKATHTGPNHVTIAPKQAFPQKWFNPPQPEFRTEDDLTKYHFKESESPFDEQVTVLGPIQLFSSADLSKGRYPRISFIAPPTDALQETADHWIEVQLRCRKCIWDKHPREWKPQWPFPCFARLLGVQKTIQLNQAQRFTNGKLLGTDMATDIADSLNNPGARYDVQLERNVATNAGFENNFYVFFIARVKIAKAARVLQKIEIRSMQLMREQLGDNNYLILAKRIEREKSTFTQVQADDEIAVHCEKLSMRCPLSYSRIRVPVRGVECKHAQCFDFYSFYDYAKTSLKFECPVCNRKDHARPDHLVFSFWFKDVLDKYPNLDEVDLNLSTGECEVASHIPAGAKLANKAKEGQKPNAHAGGSRDGAGPSAVKIKLESIPYELKNGFVDLTQDSDDEALNVRRQKNMSKPVGKASVPDSGIVGTSSGLQNVQVASKGSSSSRTLTYLSEGDRTEPATALAGNVHESPGRSQAYAESSLRPKIANLSAPNCHSKGHVVKRESDNSRMRTNPVTTYRNSEDPIVIRDSPPPVVPGTSAPTPSYNSVHQAESLRRPKLENRSGARQQQRANLPPRKFPFAPDEVIVIDSD